MMPWLPSDQVSHRPMSVFQDINISPPEPMTVTTTLPHVAMFRLLQLHLPPFSRAEKGSSGLCTPHPWPLQPPFVGGFVHW